MVHFAIVRWWKSVCPLEFLLDEYMIYQQIKQQFFTFPGHPMSVTMYPDSKVYGANMGPTRGWQDTGGPHAGPMTLTICVYER